MAGHRGAFIYLGAKGTSALGITLREKSVMELCLGDMESLNMSQAYHHMKYGGQHLMLPGCGSGALHT